MHVDMENLKGHTLIALLYVCRPKYQYLNEKLIQDHTRLFQFYVPEE